MRSGLSKPSPLGGNFLDFSQGTLTDLNQPLLQGFGVPLS